LEQLKIPSWPSIATYREWKTQLARNVNTTANRYDDTAIGWLHEAFKVGTTFEQFYDCPREFLGLDRKLARGLPEILPKYLLQQLTNKETAYQAKGQQIKGRQILWMVCREFDVNTDLGFMYSIEDLSLLPYPGDGRMQEFLNKWDEILSFLEVDKIEPMALAKMFQKKLMTSKLMSNEIARWRRLPAEHPDRSYEWLRRAVETTLRLDRKDANQDRLCRPRTGRAASG